MAVIIFRRPTVTTPGNDKVYKDSIAVLQAEIDSSRIRQQKLEKSYDSLVLLDPPVIYRTRDKIQYILTNATPDELDSIIRSTWKTESRYR
jgi:hypothetical protein